MGMGRRSRAEMLDDTHARLIAAARDHFGRLGYAGTSMDELTASAGLTRGALYHHFGGKSGLLGGVVAAIDAELCYRLGKVSSQHADPLTALIERSRVYLELTQAQDVQQIMFKDAPAVLPDESAASADSCVAAIAELFEQARDANLLPEGASPRTLAILLNGALRDASRWVAQAPADERVTRLALASETAASFIGGLRAASSAET